MGPRLVGRVSLNADLSSNKLDVIEGIGSGVRTGMVLRFGLTDGRDGRVYPRLGDAGVTRVERLDSGTLTATLTGPANALVPAIAPGDYIFEELGPELRGTHVRSDEGVLYVRESELTATRGRLAVALGMSNSGSWSEIEAAAASLREHLRDVLQERAGLAERRLRHGHEIAGGSPGSGRAEILHGPPRARVTIERVSGPDAAWRVSIGEKPWRTHASLDDAIASQRVALEVLACVSP